MLTPDDVHQLATDGAKLEIVRLEQRLAELRAEFPAAALALDGTTPRKRNGTTIAGELRRAVTLAIEAPIAPATKPPRPPMSAKARRAISRAQKIRWRNHRNGKH